MCLIGIFLFLGAQQKPMAQSLEEQTVLAALALNIVRFTTWPNENQDDKAINLCVVGDNVVQQSFSSIDNKAVGDKTLHIINLTRLRNLEQCHSLYVSQSSQNVLLQLFALAKKKPLLTIGETADFAKQGGMVGLENVDGKMTLNVNLEAAKESNLNISARLLKLAKIISD